MFKIGEFSRLSRISVRMLRYYDKFGLLVPAEIDAKSGYRLYSVEQLPHANKITTLRDMGFGIEDIKRLSTLDDEALANELERRGKELRADIERSERMLSDLENLRRAVLTGSSLFDYEVSLVSVPAYDVVSLRMTISAYDDERLAWEALGAYMKAERISVSDPYIEFCEFHNEGGEGEGVDIEVAVAVDETREGSGAVRFYRTQAYPEVASVMIYGPYENIASVYASFAQWLEAHPSLEMAGNTREIAHRGCWNADDPSEYLTEFQIPVQTKTARS